MKYIDRVAPLIVGAKLKKRDSSFKKLWTITDTRRSTLRRNETVYVITYDGPEQAITARNKEDLREDFEYMFHWEYTEESLCV